MSSVFRQKWRQQPASREYFGLIRTPLEQPTQVMHGLPALREVQDVRCTGLLVLHVLLLRAGSAPVPKLPPFPAGEIKAEQRKQQIAQLRSYLGQLSRLDNVAFQLRARNRHDWRDTAR